MKKKRKSNLILFEENFDWSQSMFLNICANNKELFGVFQNIDMTKTINI